ncbi:hypothetical protein SAMN05444128_1254 [Pontibacter indicus]|uniref:Uncharacterized protein n=1 Tax=Pontibacter indicus TaxID=1317125 RepID=A0A1R3WZW4_9BACT|nr:hypothetical protein SAMN05444128_1254 [Pontibacter indicus]
MKEKLKLQEHHRLRHLHVKYSTKKLNTKPIHEAKNLF